ncbi:MAG: hypothetical protein M0D55_01770 [Elusimicrobiota bacterium]|nr:MAG: hypothetical protein M0D55_01770 [Elusimicrobiota bacterium]
MRSHDEERGLAFRRIAAIILLLMIWSVRAGMAPPPSVSWPGKGKPAPGRPAKDSAKVSWETAP